MLEKVFALSIARCVVKTTVRLSQFPFYLILKPFRPGLLWFLKLILIYCGNCSCLVSEMSPECVLCDAPLCSECVIQGKVNSMVQEDHSFCPRCIQDGFINYNKSGGVRAVKRKLARFNPAPSAPLRCGGTCGKDIKYSLLRGCSNDSCRKLVCEPCGRFTKPKKWFCLVCKPI